jgi:hypothetical protein
MTKGTPKKNATTSEHIARQAPPPSQPLAERLPSTKRTFSFQGTINGKQVSGRCNLPDHSDAETIGLQAVISELHFRGEIPSLPVFSAHLTWKEAR